MRRRLRVRGAFTRSARTALALCVAGLSLSNAAPQPGSEQQLRFTLAEVERVVASPSTSLGGANALIRCRSSLDGSFSELVDATARIAGNGGFKHIVTDITSIEGTTADVAMIFHARGARGLDVVSEARATIDLETCLAADISLLSV